MCWWVEWSCHFVVSFSHQHVLSTYCVLGPRAIRWKNQISSSRVKNKIKVIEVQTSNCKTLQVCKCASGQRGENGKRCLHQASRGNLELLQGLCGGSVCIVVAEEIPRKQPRARLVLDIMSQSEGVSIRLYPEDSFYIQATMSEIWASCWIPTPYLCLHPMRYHIESCYSGLWSPVEGDSASSLHCLCPSPDPFSFRTGILQ